MATEITIDPSSCCVVACPLPALDIRGYEAFCTPRYSSSRVSYQNEAHNRGVLDDIEVWNSGTESYDDGIYLVPLPQRAQTFASKTIKAGGDWEDTTMSVTPAGDPYIKSFQSAGGENSLTETYNSPCGLYDCQGTPATVSGVGGLSHSSYGNSLYFEDNTHKTFKSFQLDSSWVFAAGTTINNPNYDPNNDPPEDEFLTPESDDFIRTVTTIYTSVEKVDGEIIFTPTETTEISFAKYNQFIINTFDGIQTSETVLTRAPNTRGEVTTHTQGDKSYTDTNSEEWLDPHTEIQLLGYAEACLNSKDKDSDWAGDVTTATKIVDYRELSFSYDDDNDPETAEVVIDEVSEAGFERVSVSAIQFRFVIPHDFSNPPEPAEQKWHGTKQVIEYQTVFTPFDHIPAPSLPIPDEEGNISEEDQDAYDAAVIVAAASPQKVITPGSVTWTGEGTVIDFDIDEDYTEAEQAAFDSWKTPWVDVDVPADKGETVVELVRWQCYTGGAWHS